MSQILMILVSLSAGFVGYQLRGWVDEYRIKQGVRKPMAIRNENLPYLLRRQSF